MARDSEYWSRKEHYEKYGVWPKTQKQKDEAAAAERQRQDAESSRRRAAGINPNVSSEQAKEILRWDKANPDNAKYDNDGNPIGE